MVNEERLVETFLELVAVDSISYREARVAARVGEQLEALGMRVSEDQAAAKIGGESGNIIGYLPGDEAAPTILFNAHLDTVEPGAGIEPRIDNSLITSNGDTVLGADDKAGVAVIIEALRVLTETQLSHPPIEAVFTVAEEKGLLGAKALEAAALRSEMVFVFDSAGPAGHVTVRAPYQDSFEAVFHGKASHAGVEPEKGANAILAAAKAISRMQLGRVSPTTTANIGVINGGRASNIIADRVSIKGEARGLSEADLKEQTRRMLRAMEIEAETCGCTVEIDLRREYDGFNLTSQDKVVEIVSRAAREVGIDIVLESTGGGSDTNVFNALGLPAISLAVGYTNPHSVDETLAISDLVAAANMAVAIARAAAEY